MKGLSPEQFNTYLWPADQGLVFVSYPHVLGKRERCGNTRNHRLLNAYYVPDILLSISFIYE